MQLVHTLNKVYIVGLLTASVRSLSVFLGVSTVRSEMLSSESFAMSQWLFRSNAMMTKLQALVLRRTITTTASAGMVVLSKKASAKWGTRVRMKVTSKMNIIMKLVLF